MRIFTTKRTIDGEVMVNDAPQAEIVAEAGKYKRAAIIVTSISDTLRITYAQIKWIKGILLPGLSNQTGYSVGYWENELKLGVMPDVFQPITTTIDGQEHNHLGSITILSKTEANEFIEGTVAYLRAEKRYNKRLGKRFGN